MKTCSKCGETKSLKDFGKDSARKDGLRAYCRMCNSKSAQEWYRKNPEKAAQTSKAYAQKTFSRRKEYSRQWQMHNKEHLREYNKLKHLENRETIIARVKEWSIANRDKVRRNKAKYKKRYPAKSNADGAARRAARLKATPPWLTAIQRAQIAEFYEVATARSVQTGVEHHVDHIHPLRGENFRGLHVPWNLQVITGVENSRKKNQLVGDGAF